MVPQGAAQQQYPNATGYNQPGQMYPVPQGEPGSLDASAFEPPPAPPPISFAGGGYDSRFTPSTLTLAHQQPLYDLSEPLPPPPRLVERHGMYQLTGSSVASANQSSSSLPGMPPQPRLGYGEHNYSTASLVDPGWSSRDTTLLGVPYSNNSQRPAFTAKSAADLLISKGLSPSVLVSVGEEKVSMSVEDYLNRLMTKSHAGSWMLERATHNLCDFLDRSRNARKPYLPKPHSSPVWAAAALMIAAKSGNDSSPKSKHWARYGGINNHALNDAELKMLYKLEWDVATPRHENEFLAFRDDHFAPAAQRYGT